LLTLLGVPGAQPQPKRSTGLFHVAILLPSRAELGSTLTRLARALPARRRVRPSGERGALPYRS
jgi:catechol-2,3-dioxygenase